MVNLSISGYEFVGGLVGYNLGTVKNCYATGNVSGDSDVGVLVGRNKGTVQNSYATGKVNGGSFFVGGLVGHNDHGMVQNSYATGKVSGYRFVGGLVGNSEYGIVQNSYATGKVNGDLFVGGLVGQNYDGTVKNCYATGKVSGNDIVGGLVGRKTGGTVKNGFWDIETSGTNTSAGGTGKNTTDMMKKNTFTDAGWNLNDTWSIIEGKSYPFLLAFTYPPIILTEDVSNASEDDNHSVHYHALVFPIPGYGYPQILWGLNTNAGWLSMSPDGVLTGTPTNDDVGTFRVNVSVSDETGGSDYTNFTLTVENTNDLPVIQTIALTNATEGQAYGYNLTSIDVDGDTLVWSLETNASWITLDSNNGTIQGTPTGPGTFWLTISVTDGNGGIASANLTITVLPDLDGDGIPDPEDSDKDGDGVPNTSDAFPKDPKKWEEEKESDEDESFLSQQFGPLPFYAYLVFVIIGLVGGAGALKMKGKSNDAMDAGSTPSPATLPDTSLPSATIPSPTTPPTVQTSYQQQPPMQYAQPQTPQQYQQQPQYHDPQTQVPQQVPTPSPHFPSGTEGIWSCPRCGNQSDVTFMFCIKCGTKRGN